MKKFTNPLDNIRIASPCRSDWNAMYGNERKRFCAECKLNVYNLSDMTKQEAETFLINSEGRVCVKFYRRADGSVITRDCPVGWQAIKRRVSKMTTAFASLVFGVAGGLGLTALFSPKKISVLDANIAPPNITLVKPVSEVGEIQVLGEFYRPVNPETIRSRIKH